MGTIQNTVSSRIRTLRLERRMSQAELGKAIGNSQASIAAYENGVRKPDIETLGSIAKALFVPLPDFFKDFSVTYFSQADIGRLKVFHDNEELASLFDKIYHLSQSDFELVNNIVNRLQRTRSKQ